MRDYYLVCKKYNIDTFIKHFYIKNNEIIIKYANLKTSIIPYSKENLKRVLEKIKTQIYIYAKYINDKFYYEPGLKKAALSTIRGILIDGVVIGSGILSFPVAMPIGALFASYHLYENYCEEDLELNQHFMQNESIIAKKFTKNFNNILTTLSPKAQKHFTEKINNIPSDMESYIDINDLSFIKEDDIKTILKLAK